MTTKQIPLLDLQFHREVSISPAQIWEGWTNPEALMKWFCPRPWKVIECDIDLRPGVCRAYDASGRRWQADA
jgi:uncharacterized protein YndB with AHSA1/START domain